MRISRFLEQTTYNLLLPLRIAVWIGPELIPCVIKNLVNGVISALSCETTPHLRHTLAGYVSQLADDRLWIAPSVLRLSHGTGVPEKILPSAFDVCCYKSES